MGVAVVFMMGSGFKLQRSTTEWRVAGSEDHREIDVVARGRDAFAQAESGFLAHGFGERLRDAALDAHRGARDPLDHELHESPPRLNVASRVASSRPPRTLTPST